MVPVGLRGPGRGWGRVPRREKLAGQWAGQAWDRQLSYACSRRAGREEVQEEPGDTPPGARVDLTLTGKAGLGHPGARIPSSSFHSLSPDEEKKCTFTANISTPNPNTFCASNGSVGGRPDGWWNPPDLRPGCMLVALRDNPGWPGRRKLGSKCMSSFLCSTEKIYSV